MHIREILELKVKLPPEPAAALRHIFDVAQRASSETGAINELNLQFYNMRMDAEREIERLRDWISKNGMRAVKEQVEPQIAKLQASVEEYRSELKRNNVLYEAAGARSRAAQRLFAATINYLSDLPTEMRLTTAAVALPKVTVADCLSKLTIVRDEIDDLLDHVADIEQAPLPKSEMKRLAREQVKARAARANIEIGGLRNGRPFRFGRGFAPEGVGSMTDDQIGDIFARLAGAQMIAELDALIDAGDDAGIRLTPVEKSQKLAAAAAELLKAERTEEALIRVAEASGQMAIFRRSDADPRAVLGLGDDMPAPRS